MNLEDLLSEPLPFPRREEVDDLVEQAMKCLPASRTDLSSRVSHAIRTPLAAILGFREVLAMDTAVSEADRRLYAEIVEGETYRLRRFVESLQLFKALLAGDLKTQRQRRDLRETIEEALRHCALDARTKKIRVETILPDHAVTIEADHERLVLVLEHLLLNAIRASSKEGIVDIEILEQPKHISIVVEDSGFGLDAAQIETLFKPFQRITRPDDNGGELGIGLTLVRLLVERQQGTVDVDSRPMEGTRFTLTLPR